MKIKEDEEADGYYHHWCPGCKSRHLIPKFKEPGRNWTYNNDPNKPIFSPSVRLSAGGVTYCHYFITEGKILFCADSAHELAGKTAPLSELPSNFE